MSPQFCIKSFFCREINRLNLEKANRDSEIEVSSCVHVSAQRFSEKLHLVSFLVSDRPFSSSKKESESNDILNIL